MKNRVNCQVFLNPNLILNLTLAFPLRFMEGIFVVGFAIGNPPMKLPKDTAKEPRTK